MLRIRSGNIIDTEGNKIFLKGIALGGWLMMEGYMLGGENIPEHIFKRELLRRYGKNFLKKFEKGFRESFVSRADCKTIKNLGFNCVRIPFNFRVIEDKEGFQILKNIVNEMAKNRIFVILDMHAVPGSQNNDWHSDSNGVALFWEKEVYRKRYYSNWKKISDEFKNNEWIAGYDVMNEPVTEKLDLLVNVYKNVVRTIRDNNDKHIIFLEGNQWASEIDMLQKIKGSNIAFSVHYYKPVQFTFNWFLDSRYPGTILGKKWNKQTIKDDLKQYKDIARKMETVIYVGEFGVGSRCAYCGREYRWVEDILDLFDEFGFHWTYWTYKCVMGMRLPDGLFRLRDEQAVFGTNGVCTGMRYLYNVLGNNFRRVLDILKTENFTLNKQLYTVIKKHL